MTALLESLLDREALAHARERAAVPDWLTDARRAAAAALAHDGLPGPRTEEWKYTSLRALEQRKPIIDSRAKSRPIDASAFAWPEIEGPRVVFVNGLLREDLSNIRSIPGVSIATLAAADSRELERWRAPLTEDYGGAASAFARMNTALASDGPLIRIAPETRIADSIHLVFIGAADETEIAWNARAVIDIGANAALTLVEHHLGDTASAGAQLGNIVARYALGARARLDLIQIQHASAAATLIRRSEFALADDAVLSTHALEIGARLMRHDIAVDLHGRGARFTSRGVFALRERQHTDLHLDVRHVARDTTSDILWRGVADQRARGVFHGAITVAAGADGADANLSNKNLLLSPHAEIDTQPVLEIHADEVKAAHGATVGQLDESALFYLRARGLPAEAARQLLVAAFCGAALASLAPATLRERLDAMLAERLPRVGDDEMPATGGMPA